MKRGSAITRESERINAEAERKSEQRKRLGGQDPNRFRFHLKPGDSCEVVVLDATPETVAFYEHNLKKDGHYGNFESCPSEWSNCPLCSSGDNKYFAWFLTVLELRSYETKDGKEVPYSRRLLCVKQTQSVAFKRVLAAAMKANGTTRGVVLTLERDTSDKSAAIGEPVINEEGQMFACLDEDELIDEYGHAAIKAKNGDVLIKKNGLLEAFDYDTLFPKPDAKDIARRWGLSPQAGSDDEYDRASDDDEDYDDDDQDEDEAPARKSKTIKPSKSSVKSKRHVDEEDDDDFDDEDEDEDEDDEDFDEDEDDAPPAKTKKVVKKAIRRR